MSNNGNYKIKGRKPVLTKNDQYLSREYIGMYSVFRNPLNKAVYISEPMCQNMRKRTFDAIMFLCKQYNSPNFADLFNYNAQVIGEAGLNFFAEHDKIAPISGIIQCFQKIFPSDKYSIYISFGIKKELLKEYFDTGICPKIEWPSYMTRDAVIFGTEDIKFFADKIIKIPKNQLYQKFLTWCRKRNISESDALTIALSLLMKKYKINSTKDFGEYEPITVLDRNLFSDTSMVNAEERAVYFSGVVLSQADKIIARYNRDPDNVEKKKMDFKTYCNNAVALLNKSMPDKYTNPKIFYEYLKKKSKDNKNF